jgi:hypothetical protein
LKPSHAGHGHTLHQGDESTNNTTGKGAEGKPLRSILRNVHGLVTSIKGPIAKVKQNLCPELAKALAHAKRNKAVLCCAKLDRLSRNVEVSSEYQRVDTESQTKSCQFCAGRVQKGADDLGIVRACGQRF